MTVTRVYDFWSDTARADPQSIYARMRVEDPVHRAIGPHSGHPIWILTRYEAYTECQ